MLLNFVGEYFQVFYFTILDREELELGVKFVMDCLDLVLEIRQCCSDSIVGFRGHGGRWKRVMAFGEYVRLGVVASRKQWTAG